MLYDNLFYPGTDYKKAFHRTVDELIEKKMPVTWKNKAIEDLTDAYINQRVRHLIALSLYGWQIIFLKMIFPKIYRIR